MPPWDYCQNQNCRPILDLEEGVWQITKQSGRTRAYCTQKFANRSTVRYRRLTARERDSQRAVVGSGLTVASCLLWLWCGGLHRTAPIVRLCLFPRPLAMELIPHRNVGLKENSPALCNLRQKKTQSKHIMSPLVLSKATKPFWLFWNSFWL